MKELIAKLQEKAQACGYKTKEDRARKGAYVDCIMELKEALRIHDVSGSLQINWDDVYEEANHRSPTAFDEYVRSICNDR